MGNKACMQNDLKTDLLPLDHKENDKLFRLAEIFWYELHAICVRLCAYSNQNHIHMGVAILC